MIITFVSNNEFYETSLAYLIPLPGDAVNKPRLFSSSEQLISYLKARPHVSFSLTAVSGQTSAYNLYIAGTSEFDAYGPALGDVICGEEIHYDPTKDQVVSFDSSRSWSG